MRATSRLVAVIVATLVTTLFAISSHALQWLAYYPDDFQKQVDTQQLSDQKLKEQLFELVSTTDIRNQAQFVKDDRASFSMLSYRQARRHLFGQLHLNVDRNNRYFVKDVYCNKVFTDRVGKMKIPSPNRINCEHTWPQSRFNGRMSKSDQKTDLHHLFPTASDANSTRGNYIFAEVDGERLPGCDSSKFGRAIGSGRQAFEPPNEHKGNVARAIFYFSVRYKIKIPEVEERYLKKWHRQDPVDEFEIWRNNQIEMIQKNRNPFIDNPSLVMRISDF